MFLLAAMAASCFLASIMPNISFAQGKSQYKNVLISFRQIPGPNERALVRAAGGVIKYSYRLVPGIAASVPQAAIDGLSHNPNVTLIEDDLIVYAVDAELDNAWGVEHIGAGIVHDSGNRGAGVKVAIIDSGIDYNHDDLDENYAGGYDFVNGDTDPMDDHGHGTHCAGILAAEDNGSGVVGVAPEANIYALKVLDAYGSGSYGNVIAALEWAILNGMQVTSNSYGSSGYPGSLVEITFDLAADSGIINVCAAGNSGNYAGTGDNMIYPARFDSCIAVAATTNTEGDLRASFSSTGQQMELAAPGAGIYSTVPGGGYQSWSGTSMACPHVSGVVALMLYAGVADIRTTLTATADDLGSPGWDPQYGYGLVNAVAAVGGSSGSTNNPPVANAGPDQTLNDADGDGAEIVTLDGSNSFDPDGVIISYAWSDNGNPLGTGQILTDNFTIGTHTVILTVTDDDGQTDTDKVVVTINANDPPVADAGSDQTLSDADGDGAESVILNGSDSFDPDGTIVSYAWTEDGSPLGTGSIITYNFGIGVHTVTLTVEDDGGQTDNDVVVITINANEPLSSNTMHVDSITVTTINVGKGQKRGYAAVIIVDNLGGPVSNAFVRGDFQDDISQSVMGYTDSTGMVEFLTSDTVKGRFRLTFCVGVEGDDVTYTSLVYNPVNNVETCDSNY
jgi:subtilisin